MLWTHVFAELYRDHTLGYAADTAYEVVMDVRKFRNSKMGTWISPEGDSMLEEVFSEEDEKCGHTLG